jgi:2-phospho-L-lactate guanylyltransferase
MRTVAVLPVKTFPRAKTRLGTAYGAPERHELASTMVRDVIAAVAEVEGLDAIVVVTAEPAAAAVARDAGAHVVHDPVEAGQSAAAALGIDAARRLGAGRVLLVPGDCPALDPAELETLLATPAPGAKSVLIVPDRHGQGTNGLVLAPPDAIAPAFGPGSLARHATLAAAAAATTRIVRVPSLELDVDTPGDLAAVRERLGDRPDSGPRTQALLERIPSPAASA